VVLQLEYHPTRKLVIDLVLFINGIPVATVELKPTSPSPQKRR
jgi:type I restriction enzyme R subunit